MANVNSAFGLRPVRYTSGAPYTGAVERFFLPSSDGTAMFIGDAVDLAGSADTDGTTPTVIRGGSDSSTLLVGVIVAFEADPTNLALQYRTASTNRYCYVATDPELLFEAQEDSVGNNLAAVDMGENVTLTYGSGSTVTGLSAGQLDSSTHVTTAGYPIRLVSLVARPDNALGTNGKFLVRIANHRRRSTAGV
jgi:hypothetical protein